MKLKYLLLLSILVLSIVVIGGLIAQSTGPTAKITLDFVTPHKISENSALSATGRSTGLNNVGLGETVYLLGSGAGSTGTYEWTIEGPTGSAAAFSSTDKDSAYFQPDSSGIYNITLTVTDAGGTDVDSIKVQSGKYLSVGEVDDDIAADFPECGIGCHQDIYDKWSQTGHATAFARKIESRLSSNCIECHVLGYNTIDTAVNDGFDDIAEELGWTVPEIFEEGNWQSIKDNYPKLAQRASIQCENCHGPGEGHKFKFKRGPVEESGISKTFDAGICAYCHDAPTHHNYYPEWASSRHAVEGTKNRSSCAKCHTGKGFVLEKVKGESSGAPYTDGVVVTCAACHDPHDATNSHQLRKVTDDVTLGNGDVVTTGGLGKLCMNCHISRRDAEDYASEYHSHFGPHYSNQTDMYVGTNAIEFGLSMPKTGHVNSIKNSCVTCHMNEVEDASLVDETTHAALVGRHSFKMVYVAGSDTLQNVEPCQECHGSSVEKFDDIAAAADYDGDGTVEGAVTEIEGLMHQLGMILPPIGEPEVTVVNDYTPIQLKAAYNYEFVADDRSHGIHNTSYSVAILKAAIRAVTTGDIGAGSIVSVTDVPNDQGKQVRIRWNRFPGDGSSDNPIAKYGVWRRIDDMSLSKNASTVSSYEEMFNSLETASEGNQYVISETGEVWDFIKEVTASGESSYSTIAPTLFDSTIVGGMHLSAFYISGHSLEGGMVVKSAVDSGCSVDNLSPAAPLMKIATKSGGKVTIEWTDTEDADFNYFQVYRGTEEYFDASLVQPIVKLIDTKYTDELSTTGEKYYYKISSVDFSGNESIYSEELSEDNVVTGIDDISANNLPNVFNLEQNYPNPFNPSTYIRYQLPKNASVTINIYNITGSRVRTLVSAREAAGYHEVMWDGRDDYGSTVSSGVYIYQIAAGRFTDSKKMIFLK